MNKDRKLKEIMLAMQVQANAGVDGSAHYIADSLLLQAIDILAKNTNFENVSQAIIDRFDDVKKYYA